MASRYPAVAAVASLAKLVALYGIAEIRPIQHPLLCLECEDILNKGGETSTIS
jgi:hypothetical protein